jgi:hypothetical protein
MIFQIFHHLLQAKQLNAGSSSPIELTDDLIMQFAKICAGDISPMAAAIGGVVAQVSFPLLFKMNSYLKKNR